jgi:hypothetical protein
MSWLVGLGGLGVTAGLGVANLQAQKSALKKSQKLEAANAAAYQRLAIIGVAVVGVVLVVKVFRG